jgi:uncharacterized membrane protein YqjE
MTDSESGADGGRGPGLFASLPRLLTTTIEILHTRVDIVVTELEEERERMRELVVFGVLTLFFASFGLVLLTLFIIVVLWDAYRVYAVGGFALLYIGLGILAGVEVRRRLKAQPRLLATILEDVSKGRPHPAPR